MYLCTFVFKVLVLNDKLNADEKNNFRRESSWKTYLYELHLRASNIELILIPNIRYILWNIL